MVERDLKDVKTEIESLDESVRAALAAQESRISSLEKKVWMAAGFAASIGAGGASLWQILG
ncbi:hypothetical protein D7294_30460 [Streptomyces hoynatensis]|uniref:Uncharacterized protein n=1 Tax=Streptomyces hoynatensis TaxID=1141874 RepID=A0A3A9YFK9_9ACTN|nr:hypothetical protein D7294_30460 [Streptomyces hoynatensis]